MNCRTASLLLSLALAGWILSSCQATSGGHVPEAEPMVGQPQATNHDNSGIGSAAASGGNDGGTMAPPSEYSPLGGGLTQGTVIQPQQPVYGSNQDQQLPAQLPPNTPGTQLNMPDNPGQVQGEINGAQPKNPLSGKLIGSLDGAPDVDPKALQVSPQDVQKMLHGLPSSGPKGPSNEPTQLPQLPQGSSKPLY